MACDTCSLTETAPDMRLPRPPPLSCLLQQAGQLLLFLRQTLQLPEDAVMRNFKWAAVLGPDATQQSMQAVVAALQEHLATAVNSSSSSPRDLLPQLQTFPEVLGWDVAADLLPKLRFFEALGQPGQQLLRGTLYEPDSSWLPGLRSWSYSVAPKLALLQDVLGSEQEVGEGGLTRCRRGVRGTWHNTLQTLGPHMPCSGLLVHKWAAHVLQHTVCCCDVSAAGPAAGTAVPNGAEAAH